MRDSFFHVMGRGVAAIAVPLVVTACQSNWPGPMGSPPPYVATVRCSSPVLAYPGDTVYSVARRCGVGVRDLIDINRLAPPYQLTPGMALRLPFGTDYVVQRGDTLSGIARRLHVGFLALAEANNKAPPYLIRVGERLRMPDSRPPGQRESGTVLAGAPGGIVIQSPYNEDARTGPPPPPPPQQAATAPPPAAQQADNGAPAVVPQPRADTNPPAQAGGVGQDGAPEPETPVAVSDSPPVPQPAPSDQQSGATVAAAPTPAEVPPEPSDVSGHGFLWPVKGEVIAPFGPQGGKGQNNDGINIAAPKGTPVHAAENGVVAYVGNELKGFGNLILIKHANGWMTAYAHADQVLVRRGDRVRRGQKIATVGATGSVTSPQLHFEIRKGTEPVDPTRYLGQPVSG